MHRAVGVYVSGTLTIAKFIHAHSHDKLGRFTAQMK